MRNTENLSQLRQSVACQKRCQIENTEARRICTTRSDLSVEADGLRVEKFEPIGKIIDNFRDTTRSVYLNFVPRSPIETNTCHSV